MHEIHIEQKFSARPEVVFREVTDHVGMMRWLPGAKITLEKEGNPPPNGLGAVRKIVSRGVAVVEEVVRWEEPRRMDYRIIEGLPKDHLGVMKFEPTDDGGTFLDYTIRLRVPWYATGPLLGTILTGILHKELATGLERLAGMIGSGEEAAAS